MTEYTQIQRHTINLFWHLWLHVSTGILVEYFVAKPSLPVKGQQVPFLNGK